MCSRVVHATFSCSDQYFVRLSMTALTTRSGNTSERRAEAELSSSLNFRKSRLMPPVHYPVPPLSFSFKRLKSQHGSFMLNLPTLALYVLKSPKTRHGASPMHPQV